MSLKQPALVLWGLKDRTHKLTPKRDVLRYFVDLSKITVVEYDQIGHFPDLEQPEEFVKQVAAFIKSL